MYLALLRQESTDILNEARGDAAAVLARWAGDTSREKAKNAPTLGEVVQALHGGRMP
jgi:hypothetical protein